MRDRSFQLIAPPFGSDRARLPRACHLCRSDSCHRCRPGRLSPMLPGVTRDHGAAGGGRGDRRAGRGRVVVAAAALGVDMEVDVGPVTDTLQPAPVAGRIGMESVSKRWLTVSPMSAVVRAVATTSKVIRATLTLLVGDARLTLWKAERFVVPRSVVFSAGAAENSLAVPPAAEAIFTTVGSYVSMIEQ